MSITTTENQCPAWCAGKPGHRWEDEDNDGNPYRYHSGETAHLHVDGIETGLGRHYDGKILLAIESEEALVLSDTGLTVSTPGPRVTLNDGCDSPHWLTVDEALSLSDMLVRAALQLRKV
jgi:hypothetical protein